MEITLKEKDGRMIIALIGDLDNVASSQAERSLAPAFERKDCDMVIDCTELNYISSSGLRILLNLFKHTRQNGHETILRGISDEVEEVFDLSGFLQLFKIEK